MIKKISFVVGLGILGIASIVSADTNKVLICHNTSSAINPTVLISVSASAVDAQLAQGSMIAIQLPDGTYTCDIGPLPE